jgi:S-adenosylmethionine:tRNA-ribosyltransferase-isomerase (queuine synthetase)
MRVDLFDFHLPPERIALRPARPRDAARMLLVPGEGALRDGTVRDLPRLLRAGDVLVFNDTRVIPAQLEGYRGEARIGATLHKRIDLRRWQAFVRNAKRLREGDIIAFPAGVSALAEARLADGSWTLAFAGEEPVEVLLERAGQMPLPPYIAGKRATDEDGIIRAYDGDTDIFITPGYAFRAADLMLTNFHLPRSTLFMLVAAFCGLDVMQRAYAHAIAARYRFYSYGDACLLFRP